MKKIAVEEHWALPINEEIRKKLNERTNPPIFADPAILESQVMPRIGVEAFENYRLPEMDINDISVHLLSFGSPGIQGILDVDEAVSTARDINDCQAELIKKYPGRFFGYAAIPTQNAAAAAAELERAVTKLGFRGALVNGHTNGNYLDQKEYWALWECAEALDVPIYLHPYDSLPDQIKIFDGYPEMLGPTWNWNVETGTHGMRVLCSGIFDAFPKARMILGHMGEMIPYELGRIDEGYTTAGGFRTGRLKHKPSYYAKNNLTITTSGLWQPETMRCAIQAIGIDNILFAADYPFIDPREAVNLIENTPLTREEKEKIYFSNAARLFKLYP